MKSLAVILPRPKEPLQLIERELPAPQPGEVMLRIEACGLGLADWHVAMLDALPHLPLVLGCEAVGRVEETGERFGVTPLAGSCGECAECRAARPHRCPKASWHGFSRDGALLERGVFARQHLVPLPEGDAAQLAVLMGSGQAALAAVKAAEGCERVGVFGLGGVGHLVLQLFEGRAHAFEPDAERLSMAGAEPATSGPLDAAIVCVPSAQAIQRAFTSLRPGGRLILAAASPTGRLDLSLQALTARGISVVGTHLAPLLLSEVLARFSDGRLTPKVTRRPLSEAPAALYALRDGGFVGRLIFSS